MFLGATERTWQYLADGCRPFPHTADNVGFSYTAKGQQLIISAFATEPSFILLALASIYVTWHIQFVE